MNKYKYLHRTRHRLLVIDQYLKSVSIEHCAYVLNVEALKIEEIIKEWRNNDYCIILPSKMNGNLK